MLSSVFPFVSGRKKKTNSQVARPKPQYVTQAATCPKLDAVNVKNVIDTMILNTQLVAVAQLFATLRR